MTGEVAIVMVTFNSEVHLSRSLGPLASSFPIQVVDNSSIDQSVRVALDTGASVVRLPRNVGFAAGANVGVGALGQETRHVLFMNPDVTIGTQDVRRLSDHLDKDPTIGVVAPQLTFPDGQAQLSAREFPSLSVLLKRWRDGFVVRAELFQARPDWVIGAAMMVRRHEFEQIGGFDGKFFMYCEDVDLCWRMRQEGLSIFVDEGSTAEHLYGRGSSRKFNLCDSLVRSHWQSMAQLALRYPQDFFIPRHG